jgi:hypothetical protein
MPNRILKESICYSEDINKLTSDEEAFFYRLIVNCDDFGRMDARISILKSRLYPLREKMKSDDINRYLLKLSGIKPEPLIILYKVKDIPYLQMAKWEKHQQIRAKRSKYPCLTDADKNVISDDINGNQLQAYVPVIQSNPIQSESISESESKTAIEIAIDDFKEFRKKIKSPMTDRAVELLIMKLDKLTQDDVIKIAILNESIVNNWKGIFPLKQIETPKSKAEDKREAILRAREIANKMNEGINNDTN